MKSFYLMFLTLIQCLCFKTEISYFYWNIVRGFVLPHWCNIHTNFKIRAISIYQSYHKLEKLLWHKLRCYTGIFDPEKSRNNTREKISYFFTCVDIANHLLTRYSPLAPLGQVDEWMIKSSRFSIQVVCWSFLELGRLKH